MKNEKMERKFFEWREMVKYGKESVAYIVKNRERCLYLHKGGQITVDAFKVWLDKGKGLEEYISYKGANDANVGDFSIVIKNSSKLIFRDCEDNLHPFGLKDTGGDLKKFIAFIKIGDILIIIFASSEKNAITVIEKIVDESEDAVTACLLDYPPHQTTNFEKSGGDIDGLFDR